MKSLTATIAILIATLCTVNMTIAQDDATTTVPSSPTWLLTVPTAETLGEGKYNLGLIQGGTIPFHADVGGLSDNLEVGIHGVKLKMLSEGSPWASIAIGATFGYYPAGAYLVGTKTLHNLRIHLGARFLPFTFKDEDKDAERPVIVFGGIDKEIPNIENARLMLEVGDTLNGGVRFSLLDNMLVDVGVRVGLPERYKFSIGKSGSAIGYTSKDTTAYLAINFLSTFKKEGETD